MCFITLILSCSSANKDTVTKGTNTIQEKDRFAVIYFEIYDRRECNGDITGIMNDGEFFLLIERDNITNEKIILPVNYSSEFNRDKGFLRTPIKWNANSKESNPKLLIINLMDDDGIDNNISRLITKAETIGGIMVMTEQGFYIFKNVIEFYSGKPWDEFINKDILKLGKTQPCGNISYKIPTKPPKNIDEAQYLSIYDGNKLKMKIKIYFEVSQN
mgnify:CR=1 FL=1